MRDLQTAQLMAAQEKPGCLLCRLVGEAEERWLWAFLWENVNDPWVRERLAASWGLCHHHAWRLAAKERATWGSCSGTAILHHDLAGRFLRAVAPSGHGSPLGRLLVPPGRNGRPAGLLRRLSPRAPCPLCSLVARLDEWNVQGVAGTLADAGFRLAYSRSEGLCLPHLRRVLAGVRPAGDRDFLLDHQERVLEKATRAGSEAANRLERVTSLLGGEKPRLLAREWNVPRVGRNCGRCADNHARVDGDLRYLAAAAAGGMSDPRAAEAWRGLCRYHLWAAHDHGRTAVDDRHLADWCSLLVAESLAGLRRQPPPPPGPGRWRLLAHAQPRTAPRAESACPVCIVPEDATRRGDATSEGSLCLPHLRSLLRGEGRVVEGVLSAEERYLAPLVAELAEYIRKFDHRFRDEPRGEEQTSWWRAVAFVAGEVFRGHDGANSSST